MTYEFITGIKVSLRNLPLTIKVLLLTAIVSVFVWILSDAVQTAKLSDVFRTKLSERLSEQAEKQRIMFDRYVKGHHTAVKLFVSTHDIRSYVDTDDWKNSDTLKTYNHSPPWLPRLSVIRNFVQPRFLMLLDENDRVREVYEASVNGVPKVLLEPDRMLLSLSHDQGFLTTIEGHPYLIASENVENTQGESKATLMLASPLDEQFLIASQGAALSDTNIIALLAEQEPVILVSSNQSLVPNGYHLDDLKEHYLTIGQGFFDYGATDIIIELVSLVSTDEIKSLTREVIAEERNIRAITALSFIISFVLVIFLVTRRLQKFTNYVVNFSKNLKQDRPIRDIEGDEITILENNFNRLARAVESETAALEHQALHDPLTDLPNRKLLNNRLQQEILRAERNKGSLVLIMIDLNHFKEINDTLGHHVGDLVLQQAASRLFRTFRKTDTVARLGGDEFGILLPRSSLMQAETLCRKAVEAFEIPFVIEGNNLSLGISMGLVESPMHGDDVNILVQRADIAMYIAKRNNSGFAVYDPEQDTHSVGRLALMTEFREAIERQSLSLLYQPKIRFDTNEIVGAEALLRWDHPTRGIIMPDEFIPLAEQTGLIKPLTSWVLDKAVQQCMDWKHIWPDFNMAINLSVQNLLDITLLEQVRELISTNKMYASCLTMEITESDIMIDPIRAREILESLNMMGIKISIDDFGTGYSSLSYIKQLPVEEIKIDKSFVMEMVSDENDAVIVRATIDLAHNLGLDIVAEGVKDKPTWDYLKSLNCDIGQGFFISRPLTAEEFTNRGIRNTWPDYLTAS